MRLSCSKTESKSNSLQSVRKLGNVRFAVGIERAANSHLSGLFSIVNPVFGAIELPIVGAQRGDQSW